MSEAKLRLLYYSDCRFFAGCENMLVNFLSDYDLRKQFEITFAFRTSEPYITGLKRRVPDLNGIKITPLNVVDLDSIYASIYRRYGNKIGFLVRATTYLLLIEHLFVCLNAINLWRKLFSTRYDLIHINNGGYPAAKSCLSAVLASSLASQGPVVFVVNNMAVPRNVRTRFLDGWLDRQISKKVSRFVTGSKLAALRLGEVLNMPAHKLITLHNGIIPRYPTMTRAEARERFGVKEPTFVIGIVALLDSRKGHIIALEALAKMEQKNQSRVRLLIEGDGPEKSRLVQKVEELGIANVVSFVGTEKNIADFYQALDVLLVPSLHSEDFPNVIIEAMHFGIAVIGSNLAGIPEQIIDGKTGILVPPGDVTSLKDAISTLLSDSKTLQSMGVLAKKEFELRFSGKIAVDRYRKVYDELISDQRNNPRC